MRGVAKRRWKEPKRLEVEEKPPKFSYFSYFETFRNHLFPQILLMLDFLAHQGIRKQDMAMSIYTSIYNIYICVCVWSAMAYGARTQRTKPPPPSHGAIPRFSQICETRAIVSGIPEYSSHNFNSVPGTPGDVEMHSMYGLLGFESGQLGFEYIRLLRVP
jgi:hypothetical protein